MQRAARPGRLPLRIQRRREGERIRVDLDDRVQRRPAPVQRLDAREVPFDQRLRGQPAGRHRRLQLGDAGLGLRGVRDKLPRLGKVGLIDSSSTRVRVLRCGRSPRRPHDSFIIDGYAQPHQGKWDYGV